MNFDLSSLLKNEIIKKQKELQGVSKGDPDTKKAAPPSEIDQHEHKSQEDDVSCKKEDVLDGEIAMEEELNRLETRPKRIEETIIEESKMKRTIDPNTIGDDAKLKLLSFQCNLYIHDLLDLWDKAADEYHPELLTETKKSLFPLLIQLRRGTLVKDLVISLATVLYHLQQPNETNQAIESYMKLSIGNVAWPIGVTSVGIHARSAHSKIQGENGQVANIMLNDKTRLWITSIKRLITFNEWFNRRGK